MSFFSQFKKFPLTWTGIVSIFRKELIQLLRDPYLVAFIVALPIAQLIVTGLAVQRELRHVPTLVYNYDNRNASIELMKVFQNSQFFDLEPQSKAASEEALIRKIRKGRYRVGIVIPPDYSDKLLSGHDTAEVRLLIDGTDAVASKNILDAAQAILVNHATQYVLDNRLSKPAAIDGGSLPIVLKRKILYNPELKSANFLIPGILGIIMHMLTIILTSLSIVRERESGTLEQLLVTPLRVSDLMVGKVVPYAVIGLLDMVLTIGVMVWFFDIAFNENFGFLFIASTIFILTSLGIGILISSTCQSQAQAVQLTMGLLLPSLMLSGFVFPLEPMPWFIKIVSYSLPLTYYLEIIRGVVIKGTGLYELWFPTLILILIALIVIVGSIRRFKKRIA